MIFMTPIAVEKAKAALTTRKEAAGLRISVLGDGYSGFHYQMTLDKEAQTDDEIMDIDGLKVFVDTRSMLYLNGALVDYVETPEGSGFKFDNPNEIPGCRYGESFEA